MKKQYNIPAMEAVEVVTLTALCNVSGSVRGIGGDGNGSGSNARAPHRGGSLGPSY